MLRAELRRARPQRERELHRRASEWYALAGDADRAIDHAIDAGDAERAGELLWALPRGCSTAAAPRFGAGLTVSRRGHRRPSDARAARPRPSTSRTASGTWSSTGPRPPSCGSRSRRPRRCTRGSRPCARPSPVTASTRWCRTPRAHTGACPRTARGGRSAVCCAASASTCGATPQPGATSRRVLAAARSPRPRSSRCAWPSWLCSPSRTTIGSRGRCSPHALVRRWTATAASATRPRRSSSRCRRSSAHRERVEDAQADRRRAVEVMTSPFDDYVPWYDAEVRVVLARAALRLGDVIATAAARLVRPALLRPRARGGLGQPRRPAAPRRQPGVEHALRHVLLGRDDRGAARGPDPPGGGVGREHRHLVRDDPAADGDPGLLREGPDGPRVPVGAHRGRRRVPALDHVRARREEARGAARTARRAT